MTSLEFDLRLIAKHKIQKHERHLKKVFDENRRRQRRSTGSPDLLPKSRPDLWGLGDEFDPYHVRQRVKPIAFAIEKALSDGSYQPRRPGGFTLQKNDGSERIVTVFPIADEVVSRRLYASIMAKNRPRLSPRSYAYRDDLGVYDALTYMQTEWLGEQRVFVAQYDFKDYFGSLSHEHIWKTVNSMKLAVTRRERHLLESFLRAPRPFTTARQRATAAEKSVRGIHQGTSISLLLANIAATPLDREFERLGVSFVRYADDVVIWSRDYSSICRAVEELHLFAERSGCEINQDKSPGVELLVRPETKKSEFRQTDSIHYLSHSVGLRTVSMSRGSLDLLKSNISKHLFDNLIREPLNGTQDPSRLLGRVDRDYTVCIWQLRRELYGHLSEEQLRRLLRSPLPANLSLNGTIARFPLLNDTEQLRDLDSWIATQTWLALRRRSRLISRQFKPHAWMLGREALINFRTTSTRFPSRSVDHRLPSALRMSQLVSRAVQTHGIQCVGPGLSLYD